MSISPIYTAAFSTIPINRGIYADRPSNGTAEEPRSMKNTQVNPSGTVSTQSGLQTVQGINPAESASKSVERKQGLSEKSTDSEKKRSLSGDILDLSGQPKSKSLESTQKSGKTESSIQPENLTPEEQAQVEKLKARDAEVRTHEAAHLAAAGQYAQGGPKFVYQTGPDGKQYAIGGSVSIDVSPVSGDPQATLQKAQQVRAAALAPADPSGQDQKVAAAASQMEADARLQLARETEEKHADSNSKTPDTYGPLGSLAVDKESTQETVGNSTKTALGFSREDKDSKESSLTSAFSRRNSDVSKATLVYQDIQAQTSPGRAFAAYA